MKTGSVSGSSLPITTVAIPESSASSSQPVPKSASKLQRSESSRALMSSSFAQNLGAVALHSQQKPLKALQRSISARDLLFNTLNETVGTLTDRCAKLEVRLQEEEGRYAELEKNFGAYRDKTEKLLKELIDANAQLRKDMLAAVAAVNGRVDKVEDRFNKHGHAVSYVSINDHQWNHTRHTNRTATTYGPNT